MPTRLLTGEGRADREETDTHLFGPPGYGARHVRKVVWVIGGDPVLVELAPPTSSIRMMAGPEVGEGHKTDEAG